VLLDLSMPVLDGYATLAEIKADPTLDHIPVIMVSAVPELSSVVRCIDLGAVDYLPKPFSADVLRARLRSSLTAKRHRDAEHQEVTEREAALRAEIAALRAEIDRTRTAAEPG
jgi:SARP family transcriptional regulator, regulator of embCAB operon